MNSFKSLMKDQQLLPIIQANSAEEGVQIAGAMRAGGIHLVEVVLRTEASIEALEAIKAAYPDMCVGAGTVISVDTLDKALAAGADFIVTPAISNSLLQALKACPVPVLPGVSNTGDILLASEYGFTELKLFPASLAGGAAFIKAMSSVFQQISFCPTGGVSADNRNDFLSLPNCFAVGGTWVAAKAWVEAGDWQAITDACAQANA
ncbi:bifunctional 4-hydroxy-2-oxoglutarate aldolase/2-dehydro-3-deoxy-phosphogluconate aldolase [Neiella sp. HB171785]|uniref:Bifunctional 4-hydroxy-2-oxoglutarate aldolase/2-dehydro-3-deoxy-phosphogluconate aldolase n=1 Tax=Neiella litorisoli TaxID=2771431 RepID=A0A8J6UE13_9GAMM|nr:bifunctional 4-hydroxy-2-oxoglutarate aldolase/2-dehydro-3-deoxy-phosphogluconate aldolase [Neiella litorisoli]MBD1389024.1 bifunctional 4-hydroxy-2-oxoglutarate aldolase/2-dehydro-3-deoxy-phosphogluconate aldolase [Neiella litorisoli]